MALTVTNRGTGGNNTSATSTAAVPNSTLPAGSFGVLCIALDNAGSAGSATIAPGPTVTDSVGNVWTERLNVLFDNGAASAGVEIAMYTAPIVTQLTSSDNLTLSWGTSVVAKAYAWFSITAAAGSYVSFVGANNNAGGTTGTPTVTTASIPSGNAVIGMGGAESASTWTGDADTTNGSWSAQQATGFGTGTTGMSVTAQSKVVTATATQTYNPTLTSVDCILGWLSVAETLIIFPRRPVVGPSLAAQQASRW